MKAHPSGIASLAVTLLLGAVLLGIHTQGETTVWGVIASRTEFWVWLIFALIPLGIWLFKRKEKPWFIIPLLLSVTPALPDLELGSPESPRGLKVIVFNIEHGLQGQDRLGTYLQVQDPDVLLLQETGPLENFPGFASVELRRALAGREFRQSKFELIAVKGKILDWGLVPLPRTQLEKQLNSPKKLLWVSALIAGKKTTIISPHLSPTWAGVALKHGKLTDQLSQVSEAKKAQIATIRRILNNRPGPALVGGDFNMRMAGPLYQDLVNAAPDLFTPKTRGFYPNRIDGLFGRGFTPVRAEEGPSNLSDHRPLIVWLEPKAQP